MTFGCSQLHHILKLYEGFQLQCSDDLQPNATILEQLQYMHNMTKLLKPKFNSCSGSRNHWICYDNPTIVVSHITSL